MSIEMMMDAAERQLTAANETLEAWKPTDSELAGFVPYAENAILLFLDRQAVMERAVERMQKLAQLGQVPDLLQLRSEASRLFRCALRPVAGHRKLLAALAGAGFVVGEAERFEQSVRDLERMRDELRKSLPLATCEEFQTELSAIEKGEFQDADAAFAEIAGVDVETWRQRIAKSQAGL